MSADAALARRADPSGLRLALTLGAAGLLSGIALAAVYEITLPRIEANRAAALRVAVLRVVPGSQHLQRLTLRDDKWGVAAKGDGAASGVFAAYAADGRLTGYAIAGEGAGFQDAIRLLFGFDPARQRIVGMHVLESRETPGLGDKIYKDKAFLDCFSDLAVKPKVVLVKGAERRGANEVDAITGATVSSKAVVSIINQACTRWISRLPPAGAEPSFSRDRAAETPAETPQ